jgi:hypothetical protein
MKLELLIPTSLDEIPLKAYQDFRKTVEGSNDEIFISEKMVSLFCGIELKDVVKIKATDLSDMVEHFNRLFAVKSKFKHRFKIGDIEFGFIPNLENISWGEYIDAEKYLGSWENMHKAMAVLYRPITKTKGDQYEIMEYTGTSEFSEIMKFTPVSIALGASVFFWTLGLELLEALADYLEKETKKMSKTTTANSLNLESNGDGISQSMQQLKETFLNLTESQSSHLLKY